MDAKPRGRTVTTEVLWTERCARVRVLRTTIGVMALAASYSLPAQQPAVATQRSDAGSADAVLMRRVTIALDGVSLERALDSVARVAHVLVQYQAPMLKTPKGGVTIHMSDAPLGIVLDHLLSGANLRVVLDHGKLTVVDDLTPSDSVAAVGIVTGRIVDSATGRGLAGATVKVAGTKMSVIAGDSGRFTMPKVPAGAQLLQIKLFGHRPAEQQVTVSMNQRTVVRIALVAAPNVLSGVVTTAAGEVDRRSIGNDITVLNADSIMRIAPVKNVTDLLADRVPGLVVQHTSGVPGAPARLRLRGIGGGLIAGASNTSNDPIIIVDGIRVYSRATTGRDGNLATGGGVNSGSSVSASAYTAPSPLDQIDPNSIETIEVFKGPSATSQWGSDAGNGVIVITTKRGQAGATKVTAAASMGINYLPGQYSKPGYYVFSHGYTEPTGTPCPSDLGCGLLDSLVRFSALNVPYLSPFGTGTSADGSVNVSGGSGTMTYNLSAMSSSTVGYLKLPRFHDDVWNAMMHTSVPSWLRRPNRYTTWGANGNFGLVPTSGLRTALSLSVFTSDQRQASAQHTLPQFVTGYVDTVTPLRNPGPVTAPLLAPYDTLITGHTLTTNVAVQSDWTKWASLPLQGMIGVSTVNRNDQSLLPYGYPVKTVSGYGVGGLSLGRGLAVTRSLSFTGTVFPRHAVETRMGLQVTQQSTEDFTTSVDSLAPGVSMPNAFDRTSARTFASNTAGWFFEPQLRIKGLGVTPGFRFDGGSASAGKGTVTGVSNSGGLSRLFSLGNLLSIFPKLNFSWIAVDREGEAPLAGAITLLRPRLALGIAGVQPDPQWQVRLLSTQLCGSDVNQCVGNPLTVYSLGNSDLHPERHREIEGGFDLELWGSRVSIAGTMYSKLTIDAIQPIQTAPSALGGVNFYENIGRVRNTGTEWSVDAVVVQTPEFAWKVQGSYSANRNVLVKLNRNMFDVAFYYTVGGYKGKHQEVIGLVEGFPIDGRWENPILGYNDANGDGRLTASEILISDSLAYVGSPQPKFQLPFSSNVCFLRACQVSVNVGFSYTHGVTQANFSGSELLINVLNNPNAPLADQAAALAVGIIGLDGSLLPRPGVPQTQYGLIQSVNSLRFNTFSLNYNVPRTVSARLHLPNLGIALQGSNLGLWTNYRGKDPDVNASNVGEQLADRGDLPQARTWSVRVDLR